MLPQSKVAPIKTFPETDVLRDSDIWEYLKYLQINRINFITTTVWDNERLAKNQLLNLIGAVNQLEFLCWDKIKINEDRTAKYLKNKPDIFEKMKTDTTKLDELIGSSPLTQMQLLLQITDWLKVLDEFLYGMKKMRKSTFVSGVGEPGNEDV